MTIIAFDGRLVSTDTLMTVSYTEFAASYRKMLPIQKNGKGKIHVMTFTGLTKFAAPMFDWYMKGAKGSVPMDDDDGALLVFIEGGGAIKFSHKGDMALPVPVPYAVGTGDDHAYALMVAAGFSAEKAVESACKHCAGCGTPVETFDLGTGRWLNSIGAKACNHDQLRDLARKCKWTPL